MQPLQCCSTLTSSQISFLTDWLCFALLSILYSPSWKLLPWENGITTPKESQLTLCHPTQPDWSLVMVHLQLHITNNNNIFYSSQWEIKAVIQLHNKSLNNSKSLNTRTYTLLDIRPLSLNLRTLIANPKFNIYYYINSFHGTIQNSFHGTILLS